MSLGAALWGGPPDSRHHALSERVPDAWLRELAAQHKDALRGLLTSCRQGRDVALQIAGKLGLTLDCCDAPTEPTDVWLRRAAAVQQALITRGAQPTSLSVLCTLEEAHGLTPHDTTVLDDAVNTSLERFEPTPEYFQGAAGLTVTDLRIDVVRVIEADEWIDDFLSYTPNLVSLHLTSFPCPLPPPAALPHLRHLSVQHSVRDDGAAPAERLRSCRSLTPYLPQLASFSLNKCDDWSVVFSAASTTNTLTDFSTDEQLTDELLTALLDHAPSLKQLSVSEVGVQSWLDRFREPREELREFGCYSDRVWGLERLVLDSLPHITYDWPVPFFSLLARLPRCRGGGQVTVQPRTWDRLTSLVLKASEGGLEVDTPEGLQRMSEWVFDFPAIYIGPTSVPPNGDLTNHLKTTLNQLTSLRTVPGVHVVFWGWGWTEPMARAVAQALPTLGHPNMGVKMPQLYETMETVMQMGPINVWAGDASWFHNDLESDKCANVAWTWGMLHVHGIDTDYLLALPDPGAGEDREVDCEVLFIHRWKQLSQADADKIITRLQHIVFEDKRKPYECRGVPTLTINCSVKNESEVQDRLRVIRAVRLASQAPASLCLSHLRITRQVVQSIQQGLPGGLKYLVFQDCKWPGDKSLLKKLGAVLPLGIRGIGMIDTLSKAQLVSFGEGLSKGRGVYTDVWVYCPYYRGKGVRVGQYVLFTNDDDYNELLPCTMA